MSEQVIDPVVDQKPAERLVTPMDESRFKSAEYERTVYVVTPHADTYPQDLLKPDYWAHVAAKLRPYDRIEARANDGTWYAEYLVLESGRQWTKVVMLDSWKLTTSDVSLSQSLGAVYEVKHRGPHCKWSVLRIADKEVMHEGEGTKAGAEDWIVQRLKAEK